MLEHLKCECVVCRNIFKRTEVLINWDENNFPYYICHNCLGDW